MVTGDTTKIKSEFGNVGFWGEGKTGVPGEKLLQAKKRTDNKLNLHDARSGNRTRVTLVGGECAPAPRLSPQVKCQVTHGLCCICSSDPLTNKHILVCNGLFHLISAPPRLRTDLSLLPLENSFKKCYPLKTSLRNGFTPEEFHKKKHLPLKNSMKSLFTPEEFHL